MDIRNAAQISQIFSSTVLNELASTGKSPSLIQILNESTSHNIYSGDLSLASFYNEIYSQLNKHYRNEYIYKNIIVKKILLGRHSINSSYVLSEFRAGSSKADLVLFNGTSQVYEIKTELDNLDRLDNQLSDYKKVFDKITVVTSERHISKVYKALPEDIGIIYLKQNGALSSLRESYSFKHIVSPEIIFDSLRKKEYSSIIKDLYGVLPTESNGLLYKECKKLFKDLNPGQAHDYMVNQLKKRGDTLAIMDYIDNAPHSLVAVPFLLNLNKNKLTRLINSLYFQNLSSYCH